MRKSFQFRKPDAVLRSPVAFEADYEHRHVVAIIPLGQSTIGLRFYSPEHILTFFQQLIEKAATVWPDNELINEYMSDDAPAAGAQEDTKGDEACKA